MSNLFLNLIYILQEASPVSVDTGRGGATLRRPSEAPCP